LYDEYQFYKRRHIPPKLEFVPLFSQFDTDTDNNTNTNNHVSQSTDTRDTHHTKKRKKTHTNNNSDQYQLNTNTTTSANDLSNISRTATGTIISSNNKVEDEITFRLVPHNYNETNTNTNNTSLNQRELPELDQQYIKTQGKIRMGQLKQYLFTKLRLASRHNTRRKGYNLSKLDKKYNSTTSTTKNNNNNNKNTTTSGHHQSTFPKSSTNFAFTNRNTTTTTSTGTTKLSGQHHQISTNHQSQSLLEIYCNSVPLGNEWSISFVLRTVWMDDNTTDNVLTLTYGYSEIAAATLSTSNLIST
jgi:hypothetical protein